MTHRIVRHKTRSGLTIAEICSDALLITAQDNGGALLPLAFEADCDGLALHIRNIAPEFFDLHTQLAGTIFQKLQNYRQRLAIIGDISGHTARSEALAALVRESNRGSHVWFVETLDELLKR